MYIYVASSWRNIHQQMVVSELKQDGHDVYDFKKDGFSWSEIDKNWQTWSPSKYIRSLVHPCAVRGFNRNMNALMKCKACVYVMPCGPSASMEMGYACGQGKLTIVYIPALREPDLMVKMAHLITTDMEEVKERLTEFEHRFRRG